MKTKLYPLIVIGILCFAAFNQKANAQCASPHNTIMNYNNGQDGNMFNITAINEVYIDSFWCNFGTGTISEIEIWYKVGTIVGSQTNAAAWTKIDSVTNITSAGFNNFTHVPIWCNINIPQGSTYGWYVTRAQLLNAAPWMRYTNGPFGSTAGGLYNSNADIQVSYAYGKDYPFGATFNPRIWNGRIFYHCCPAPPTPQLTAAPNQICASDTFTYAVLPDTNAVSYTWYPGNSGTIVGANSDSTEVQIIFNGTQVFDTLCVTMEDTCTTSDTCFAVAINPPTADAGDDTTLCRFDHVLTGNQAVGSWSVVSGAGTFAQPDSNNTAVTGMAPGVNIFRWSVGNAICDTVFDEVTVIVNPIPVADFVASDGCVDGPISFNDNSYALGGNIVGWDWDVDGDGTTDYTTNLFDHTYTSTGVMQCTLIVTANFGCQDTIIKPIEVFPNPVASFTYDPECEGNPSSFTDQSSVATTNLIDWVWDFGDGSATSQAQNPVHIYANDGLYVVTMTVTTNKGCSDTYSDTIEVFSLPSVQYLAPEVCQNDTVWFSDQSVSLQGTINYWEWDFGDASPVDYNQNTAHMYSTHGTYNVRLTVATDKQCTNTVILPQKSYPVPVPDFVQEGVCQKQAVKFKDASALDPMFGSYLVDWHWDFGDGSKASNEEVGHFYQDPGLFMLANTPVSNYGCRHTTETQILIRPRPEAKIIVLDDQVCAENDISFKDASYFDFTYDTIGIIDWNWTFGDGGSSQMTNPRHAFAEGGTYETMLIVETQYGCIDSATRNTVVYHNPVASFTSDTLEGCSPLCVTFFNESTLKGGNDLIYTWYFNDGNYEDDVNPTHCYKVADGTGFEDYVVSMKATSVYGCYDSVKLDEKIIVHAKPVADFDLSADNVLLLDPVVLIDNYTLGAQSYNWDFGDSTFSTSMNPRQHKYTMPGEYKVSLFTESGFGCSDELTKSVTVDRHQTFFIPKSFTPNGDGDNDLFFVKGEDLEYVKLWIFDRWGTELFYGEDANAVWDGRFEGKMMPIGNYAYVVEYKLVNQIMQKVHGNFIISKADK